MILLKNADVYAPEHLGLRDILIASEQIQAMAPHLDLDWEGLEVIDCRGLRLVPGFVDQHVHITGGGGEGGFRTRVPEATLTRLTTNGITTVVGLLGTDSTTRSVENLVAKTKALRQEGITAYCCTGAYSIPGPTLTGSVEKDIVFVEEIIGTKMAISDHRDSCPTDAAFFHLAAQTRTAGMIGGKPGIAVIHMGDGKDGLGPVLRALDQTNIPIRTLRPTHLNRNPALLEQALQFARLGGYTDWTCGINDHFRPAAVLRRAVEEGVPTGHMTVSSDGYGSWSEYDSQGNLVKMGVSTVAALHRELQAMVGEYGFALEEALPFVTSQVADGLDLPRKGHVRPGADADLLLLDEQLGLEWVMALGRMMVQQGVALVKGTYEE